MFRYSFVLIWIYFMAVTPSFTQFSKDLAVEIKVITEVETPSITLIWSENNNATDYEIHRKSKNGASWGAIKAKIPGQSTSYKDDAVVLGEAYEYRVTRINGSSKAYGYVSTGIHVAASEYRGKLILLIDSTVASPLREQISRLISDLEGDQWTVLPYNVSRTAAPSEVKEIIIQAYNLDKSNTKALFLLGHIPVPYSGLLAPDGHPDHSGAWPADVYYGDMDGVWTDSGVNNILASDPRNKNVPDDGKFDQSVLPSNVELQIGRVDFANLNAFSDSEIELLRKYLDKNHHYRHRKLNTRSRAVIDDNFGFFSGEAFASSAWRNFSTLTDTVVEGDYVSLMKEGSYLWSYGCGPGSYTSAGGIGSTQDFSNNALQGVFTMLFGSYFGDWDASNNFLRAALANGTTLTNAWAGRPHWFFHHMGMGENIGFSTRITQNNSSLYYTHYGARFVHIALMGDPTLRNHVIPPVKAVVATRDGYHIRLNWTSSTFENKGYYIYRKKINDEKYIRIHEAAISDTTFVDSCLMERGNFVYMVKVVKLESGPSGSYDNLSQGVMDTLEIMDESSVLALAEYTALNNEIKFTNLSINADRFQWIYENQIFSEDINPIKYFPFGQHKVILLASNACEVDSFELIIDVITGTDHISQTTAIEVYPNPVYDMLNIRLSGDSFIEEITLINVSGVAIYNKKSILEATYSIDFTDYPKGIYFLKMINSKGQVWDKMCIRL